MSALWEVSIRQADPHAFEPDQVEAQLLAYWFQSAKRILTPSNTKTRGQCLAHLRSFNPPSGSSRLRTRIIVFTMPRKPLVSIRQADPHAFEPCTRGASASMACMFQSAKRILTPSNYSRARGRSCRSHVSIRQADPHAFERSIRPRWRRDSRVSIRQADPHAFEPRMCGWDANTGTCFNPPSGSSRLRTRGCVMPITRCNSFQSAKRILTPSNTVRSLRPLPTMRVSIRQADPHAFERIGRVRPSWRTIWFQSAKRILTPSNADVARRRHRAKWFQSAKRILTPSNQVHALEG